MTRTPQMHIIIMLVVAAMLTLVGRIADTVGATISITGINPSATGSSADKLPDAMFSPVEAIGWQERSPGSKRATDGDRRQSSSPLKQIFQSRANDLFPDTSWPQNSDAYHADVSRVLGPYLTGSVLMPICDNAFLAMDFVAPTHAATHNVITHHWIPSPDSRDTQSQTIQPSEDAAAPPRSRRVVMPVVPNDAPVVDAPMLKPLIIVLPAAIGLFTLLSHVLWQFLRYRRSMHSMDTTAEWPEEAAMAEDAERTAQSVLLVSLIQRENRRTIQQAKTVPMSVPATDKETRRAA